MFLQKWEGSILPVYAFSKRQYLHDAQIQLIFFFFLLFLAEMLYLHYSSLSS